MTDTYGSRRQYHGGHIVDSSPRLGTTTTGQEWLQCMTRKLCEGLGPVVATEPPGEGQRDTIPAGQGEPSTRPCRPPSQKSNIPPPRKGQAPPTEMPQFCTSSPGLPRLPLRSACRSPGKTLQKATTAPYPLRALALAWPALDTPPW
ncbi:hypothetical protein LZ30DRAFT_292599 [Colletotrichum cereale]|nr:hypothetical protein LZ30DRAFT_292599 [Colletotrichum cereale]